MTSILGYARVQFIGGDYTAEPLPSMALEIERFHDMLQALADLLEDGVPLRETTPERLLQGPLSDVMTHAGQLAMLRRLSGDPIPPENFMRADVSADRLGADQPPPIAPGDRHGQWHDNL